MPRAVYLTSYCNFRHYVGTGEPIGHECVTLPPEALKAERAGDVDRANDILHEYFYGKREELPCRR